MVPEVSPDRDGYTSAVIWFVLAFFTVSWLVCASVGMSRDRKRRWFYARMLLLTPIWPLVLPAWGGPALIGLFFWLWEEADLFGKKRPSL